MLGGLRREFAFVLEERLFAKPPNLRSFITVIFGAETASAENLSGNSVNSCVTGYERMLLIPVSTR
jgi:hypothetical protein